MWPRYSRIRSGRVPGYTRRLGDPIYVVWTNDVQQDSMVDVVGNIQAGVLHCETLEDAENATILRVATSPNEVITADRTSYTYIRGDLFDDALARKIWVGEEIVNNAIDPRRTVSITWGEVCNVETFLLKVTINEREKGALSVVKSIPCVSGSTTDVCVVKTKVVLEEENEPDLTEGPSERLRVRRLGETGSLRLEVAKSVTSIRGAPKRKRKLQSTTTIDVMYLYTEGGKEMLGGISDTQMRTTIATAFATTNEAMANSQIDLQLSPVYIDLLPYDESSSSPSTVLDYLVANEDVAKMRDTYEADLVQLIANLGSHCGRGNLYTGNDTEAFSTVNPICLDYLSHTHEIGHNLGCYHNRKNSDTQTDYAHGYRYCNGTNPYRTIMSYPCPEDYTISRLNWFSSPEVELLDKTSGTVKNNCARAIEEHMETVSRFRPVVEVIGAIDDAKPCLNSTSSEYKCTGKENGKIIDLNRCGLTDIEADLLRTCFEVVDITAVTKIKLNVNSFTSLPYDLFEGIDSLTTLNLNKNCNLTCVPPVPPGTSVILSTCNSDIITCGVSIPGEGVISLPPI